MSQLLEREQINNTNNNIEIVTTNDYQNLTKGVKRVEGRMRLQEAVGNLPLTISVGLIVSLIVAIVSRLTPIFTTQQVLLTTGGAIVICISANLAYAFFRRRRLLDTARRTDRILGLKERISTAIEGYTNPDSLGYHEFGRLQFNDAQVAIKNIKFNKAIPLRLPKQASLIMLVLIPLLLLALFLPNPFNAQIEHDQQVQKQIQQQAQQLEELKQQIKSDPNLDQNDPKVQDLLKQLEQAKTELDKTDTNKDDALASIDKAQQELQKLSDPNTAAEKAAMDALARDLKNNDVTKSAGDALAQASPDRFDKAAQQLSQAAQNVSSLKDNPSQANQLSQSLANDSKLFSKTDPALSKQLQQASDAIKPDNLNQNPAAASQALKDLGQQLQKSGQNQQTQEQIQQAQSQLQKSEQQINQTAQQGQPAQNDQNSQQGQSGQNGQQDQSGQQSGQNGQQQDQSGQQSGQNGQQQDQSGQQSGQNSQQQDQSGQQSGQNGQQQGQSGQQSGQNGQQQGQSGQQSGQNGQQQGQSGQQSGQNGQQQGQSGQQSGQNGQQQGQSGQNGQQQGNSSTGNQSGQGGSKAGDGHVENVYANSSLVTNQNGQQVNIPGKQGSGPTNNQQVTSNQANGNTTVPLSDVVDAYKNAASEALDKNYVPITLKDVVKQYFNDLENGTSSNQNNSNTSNSNGK
jgi:hypothetical protein